MNSISLYSQVRLITDKYLVSHGVGYGDVGYVIEKYEDNYEVEFSNSETGITKAIIVVGYMEIEIVKE